MDETATPLILVVDENPTVRRCMVRALESVGAAVEDLEVLPEHDTPRADLSLVVFDCSRPEAALWDKVRAWSDGSEIHLLPVTVRPEDFPAEMLEVRGVEVPLPKPYTPYQLCAVSFALVPELNPSGGDPPFPAEPLTPLDVESDVEIELDSAPEVGELVGPSLDLTQVSDPIGPLFAGREDVGVEGEDFSLRLRPDLGVTQANELIVTTEGVAIRDVERSRHEGDGDSDGARDPSEGHGGWQAHDARTVEMSALERDDAVGRMKHVPSQVSTERRTRPLLGIGAAEGPAHEPDLHIDDARSTDARSTDASVSSEIEQMLNKLDDIEVSSLATGTLSKPSLPMWAETLSSLWPALARESQGAPRTQLMAVAMASRGLPAEDYWSDRGRAEDAKQRLAILRQAYAVHGDLGLVGPFDCLAAIGQRGLHGTLEVSDPFVGFQLLVEGDVLIRLEPRRPRGDLLLGRILAAEGRLGADAVERIADLGTPSDATPLGAMLMDVGLIDAAGIRSALRRQAKGYFAELAAMRKGQFMFRKWSSADEVRSPSEGLGLDFRISHLVMELLREGEIRTQTLRDLPNSSQVRLLANNLAVWRFGIDMLTDVEQDVLALFAEAPESPGNVGVERAVIERLFCLGLVEIVDGT